jgi:hypothetical protein
MFFFQSLDAHLFHSPMLACFISCRSNGSLNDRKDAFEQGKYARRLYLDTGIAEAEFTAEDCPLEGCDAATNANRWSTSKLAVFGLRLADRQPANASHSNASSKGLPLSFVARLCGSLCCFVLFVDQTQWSHPLCRHSLLQWQLQRP